MTHNKIPEWAFNYPDRAQTIDHFYLPFYCINCWRKMETVYLTPNFGPFCGECLRDAEKVALVKTLMEQS